MPPPRIDLGELKSQLAKRLGPERARRYFSYLHQLLSLKLRKSEFNKLCFLTIGRENVPLHNQLIQSVIKNAYQAKTPPPLEDRDFIKQKNDLKLSHGPLHAPLGIPFCPASVGRAKRSLSAGGSTRFGSFWSFSDSGELCHTEDLRKRMERIAERHGLGGVTLDSANLLNHSLDVYLQRLIKSSMELVRARVGPETIKQPQERKCCLITRQDFTVAMKLNPQQLGEDAALWLEKICFHSFEE
ncbi:hypothetical protein MA16_Dca012931 [Dendrobium catenatum]|uniref:Transcriptional coactivator Hfi1/Transcriptional adapter 1 n=1 Tax=Dendrobium catenatum TaxID=906689 RepID=A0A2I0W1R3_9ASPA|nr:hypothetical protein MA16_Dca012931 [Dendrobium catenatum]